MARRKDHTREELRGLCLAAARDIIDKKGFMAFSAREVARRIGYTVGTVHNVFGGYDEFILAINGETLEDWRVYLEQKLSTATAGQDLLVLALGYLSYSQKHYALWSVLFDYHFEKKHALPDWYQVKVQAIFGLVEKAIAPYIGNNASLAQHEARLLWSSVHGITALALSNRLATSGAESPEKLISTYVERSLLVYATLKKG